MSEGCDLGVPCAAVTQTGKTRNPGAWRWRERGRSPLSDPSPAGWKLGSRVSWSSGGEAEEGLERGRRRTARSRGWMWGSAALLPRGVSIPFRSSGAPLTSSFLPSREESRARRDQRCSVPSASAHAPFHFLHLKFPELCPQHRTAGAKGAHFSALAQSHRVLAHELPLGPQPPRSGRQARGEGRVGFPGWEREGGARRGKCTDQK